MTWAGWERQLLGALGVAPTFQRVTFLKAWARAEGGTAHFNPMNTTLRLPSSRSYNSAGVQSYADALQGIAATLLTLRLDYYADVRAALHAEGLPAAEIARACRRGLDTWGTRYAHVAALLP